MKHLEAMIEHYRVTGNDCQGWTAAKKELSAIREVLKEARALNAAFQRMDDDAGSNINDLDAALKNLKSP